MISAAEVFREITPLTPGDCFVLFSRDKKRFDFPVHRHQEMELNLIFNAAGAKRVVGEKWTEIKGAELVLLGPNLPHGWLNHHCSSNNIREHTIQFHHDILGGGLLQREQLARISAMFSAAARGVWFTAETIEQISPQIIALSGKNGFDSVIGFLRILHELSLAPYECLLENDAVLPLRKMLDEEFMDRAFAFMNNNYQKPLSFAETAQAAKIPASIFNRMIKRSTGFTFKDCLSQIRLGHVSRMLIENNYSVGEIAYRCGFNNLANFNRIFKHKKKCTPSQFRDKYNGNRAIV